MPMLILGSNSGLLAEQSVLLASEQLPPPRPLDYILIHTAKPQVLGDLRISLGSSVPSSPRTLVLSNLLAY